MPLPFTAMGVRPELERKVRQLENDVQAIYVMLTDISATQRQQGERMDKIAGKLEDLSGVQAQQGAKLDELTVVQAQQGAKLDELTVVQAQQGAKLDEHGAKLDDHGAKLDTILELLRANAS